DEVFSFVRRNGDEKILVVINFSNEARTVSFDTRLADGAYADFNGDEDVAIDVDTEMSIAPWGWKILIAQ
ncbi:MAG: alpha-glucosidase C-terminal domain-containing protein, partial [Pseudomonadota bacterium]